jgi:A/G-specific adenine glycosylase
VGLRDQLQLTQVATVIPYYARFMQRFPDVDRTGRGRRGRGAAPLVGTWLTTAARATCIAHARIVRDGTRGRFPASSTHSPRCPVSGRSTAGAILALACGTRAPILDGNAKRVLSRLFAVDSPVAAAATTEKQRVDAGRGG